MENLRIEIELDRPIQVGAYGNTMIIKCPSPFDDNAPIEILIKSKKTKVLKTKPATLVDSEEGVISYVVQEDDFTNAGSHDIQISQTGDNFKYLSPTETIPVFRSIESE